MIKIGITGQSGFVGQHLYNTLGLYAVEFERISFQKEWLHNDQMLDGFVRQCDVIIHLAAINRHPDPQMVYDGNLMLASRLHDSLLRTGSKVHLLFSSSTQEERNNEYGLAKKQGREMFEKWAAGSGASFTGLIIPNVFGPFGKPFYNSVIATFCHQLTHGEMPTINVDGQLKLIYIDELVKAIIDAVRIRKSGLVHVQSSHEISVSGILEKLLEYKLKYLEQGIIPSFSNSFERNLFNTFRSYIDQQVHFPLKYKQHTDARGTFVELIRLEQGGQVSFSTTLPGITRGNHFHTRKIERFSVIKGKALIQLRRIGTKEVFDFYLDGAEPAYVDMPIWFTHNIRNIGDEELYTNFWINETYDPADPDTFFETV